MSEGFVGWLSFGVQVALAPGEDPEDFAEELAELMQFNLAGGDRLGGALPHRRGAQHGHRGSRLVSAALPLCCDGCTRQKSRAL